MLSTYAAEISTQLTVYVIFITLILIKLHFTSLIQAISRVKSGLFRYPDDAKFFGKKNAKASSELSKLDQISNRVWQNDIENIFPFLVVGLLFTLICNAITYQILYFSLFFIFRVLHTVFMYFPRQPWRNFSYMGANIITFITLIHSLGLLIA